MLDSMRLSESQRSSLETATAAYETQMSREAASYLTARGIDQEAATGSRLGYVDEPVTGHEGMRSMLSIPYITRAGVVGIKFRKLNGGKPKYLGLPGQHPRLYGVESLFTTEDFVVICEGELDAIVGSRMVGVPCVGVPGTGTWLDHFSRCFAEFDRVIVVMDNDDKPDGSSPGQAFGRKVAGTIPGATVIAPPPGFDMTDWYLADGADAIKKAMGVL